MAGRNAREKNIRKRKRTPHQASELQVRAEDALLQSLNLMRAITEGTTDAIYAKGRDGHYLMINTAGARLVGKSPEEVIGLDDTQLFSAETAARIIARDRSILDSGETRTDEDTSATPSGILRGYLTTKGPLRDSSGAITGLFGISRDITARKQADEKLRESEARFRELAESIDEVFWVWTANLERSPVVRESCVRHHLGKKL